MDQIQPLFDSVAMLIGYADIILRILGALALVAITLGSFSRLTQAAWRFSLALFRKKVFVLGNADDFETIQTDLDKSGLLKKKNIVRVAPNQQADLDKALLIVYAHREENDKLLEEAMRRKSSRCGLIVYCPSGSVPLNDKQFSAINDAPFTTVCNFRGRLVNDILMMMLSTSFSRKDIQ